jgi:type II secretory pathway predicted ATPase ExeA
MAKLLDSSRSSPPKSVTDAFRESEPASYLASRSQEATLEALFNVVREQQQLLVITGQPGAGKTTVMRKLARELAGTLATVFCPATRLDFHQILSFVCADLQLSLEGLNAKSELDQLTEYLAGGAPKPVALLVDDADRLHGDALNQLLRLSHAIGLRRARFHLVLSGRPELQERLTRSRASYPAVARAIFARLTRLSGPESEALLERLIAERRHHEPVSVSPAARQRLVELGQGVPGRLGALYAAAASSAEQRSEAVLSVKTVEDAASARRWSPPKPGEYERKPMVRDLSPDEVTPLRESARAPSARWRAASVAFVALGATIVAVVAIVQLVQTADSDRANIDVAGRSPFAAAPAPPPAERSGLSGPATGSSIVAAARRAMPEATTIGPDAATENEIERSAGGAETTDVIAHAPVSESASAGAIRNGKKPAKGQPTATPVATRVPGSLTPTDRAWSALRRNALTTPADDNAVKWAEVALAIEPNDKGAIRVLRTVVDSYLRWCSNYLERNRIGAAAKYLDKARSLDRYATREQLAAIRVLDKELVLRQKRMGYYSEGPKWLNDLHSWLRTLPLPRDD